MNRTTTGTGPGRRPGRQAPHCSHGNLGRREGGKCGYGRRSNSVSRRPFVSIVSALIGRIAYLVDMTIRRLSTGSTTSILPGDSSRRSAASLPDKQFGSENVGRLQDTTRHLPEDNETSQLIADKQE